MSLSLSLSVTGFVRSYFYVSYAFKPSPPRAFFFTSSYGLDGIITTTTEQRTNIRFWNRKPAVTIRTGRSGRLGGGKTTDGIRLMRTSCGDGVGQTSGRWNPTGFQTRRPTVRDEVLPRARLNSPSRFSRFDRNLEPFYRRYPSRGKLSEEKDVISPIIHGRSYSGQSADEKYRPARNGIARPPFRRLPACRPPTYSVSETSTRQTWRLVRFSNSYAPVFRTLCGCSNTVNSIYFKARFSVFS